MELSRIGRLVALTTAVTLAFAGCGGAGTTSALPLGAMTQSSAHQASGKSWMKPGASSSDLIYAVGGCGGTCVISYSDGTLVGSLDVQGNGDCSDANGNIFITSPGATVTEFAHGGTNPINTLKLPGDEAHGCSVDPTTNNLAVVFESKQGDIAIFPNEQGSPSVYGSKLDSQYCGYDASSNLFVDGYNSDESIGLSELPEGSPHFTALTINSKLGEPPSQVQWDGHYITYQSAQKGRARVSRLSISGSTATVVHTTRLKRITSRSFQSWIYKGSIVVPFVTPGKNAFADKVGIWKYPAGGKPTKTYTDFPDNPNFDAVAVSVAP
jgi:hypothetical protein